MSYLKKTYLTLAIILSVLASKADVIFSPVTEMGAVVSLEGIAGFELAFSQSNTLHLWGGGGFVFPLGGFFHPAYGAEAALEVRQYFKKKSFQNFNIGLYAGIARMNAPELYNGQLVGRETLTGFVPGLKFTYKLPVSDKIVAEPYLSLSAPIYEDHLKNVFEKNADAGFVVTLGVRIGLNMVKNLLKQ